MKYLLIISILLFSCIRRGESEKNITSFTEFNDTNFKQVKQHFSKHPEDSLKLKAAEFLISYMPYHYSYYGEYIDSVNTVFTTLYDNSLNYPKIDDDLIAIQIKEHLSKYRQLITQKTVITDDRAISPSYMIDNINLAFEIWNNSMQREQIPFNIFCEHILPYRIHQEQPDNWRSYLYDDYLDIAQKDPCLLHPDSFFYHVSVKENSTLRPMDYASKIPFDMNFSQMSQLKAGDCLVNTAYNVFRLRAAGIPATFDLITCWGNSSATEHALVGNALKNKQVPMLITNDNIFGPAQNKVFAMPRKVDYNFTREDLPNHLYVQHVKTVHKVWRYQWSTDPDILNILITTPHQQIYSPILQPNLIDVSDEYINGSDVAVDLNSLASKYKIVYLAVFDRSSWEPVAYAVPSSNKAEFYNMGKNIMYLPVVYDDNSCIPINNPFYIDENGTKIEIIGNENFKQQISLVRKYPYFSNIAERCYPLKNMRIEASHHKEFKDAKVLYHASSFPHDLTVIETNNTIPYRYIRFRFSDNKELRLCEVNLFHKTDSLRSQIEGKPFFDNSLNANKIQHKAQRAFDNSYLTSFDINTSKVKWVGLDLGDTAKIIDEIHFCPSTDANFIEPECDYELLYWDSGWVSLGVKKALSNRLVFDDVPCNCLFWLHCLTKGKEERIFTYKDGMQIWW